MLKSLIRGVFFFWLFIFGIAALMNLLQDWISGDECPETFVLNTSNDIHHFRNWNSSVQTENCLNYEILRTEYEESNQKRNTLSDPPGISSFDEYWGGIYRQLLKSEKEHLSHLIDSLGQLRLQNNFDRNEFAYTVISFVQDIPYTLIATDCDTETNDSNPCYNGGEWGILAPAEFLYTLKGDCDTRTVLLFLLLNQFGYDPLVMVSREYSHSMLALDIQAAGLSVMHRNTKHYFWETTNTGWQPGMISPEMQNLDYWHIALYNEL